METSKNVILQSETVDTREVQNKSPNMEREGVARALRHLKDLVKVVEVTTDSSTAVTKMLCKVTVLISICMVILLISADKYPQVLHSMDIWHKAKLLRKVLNNVRFCLFISFQMLNL